MKSAIMKKFGPLIGLLVLAAIVALPPLIMPSCKSTEGLQRLQPLISTATEIGLRYAQARGYIEPGDKILIQRGVGVITSPGDTETKLLTIAELGLESSAVKGLIKEGDLIELKADDVVLISSEAPPTVTPPTHEPDTPLTLPAESAAAANPLLPPPGK